MGKTIDNALLPYFFKSGIEVYTAYVFSIDDIDDYKYVANNEDLSYSGTYTALAIKRNPIRSEEGTVLNELEIGLDYVDLAFKSMVMSGKFNNKTCKIYLMFVDSDSVQGMQLIFEGKIDEPKGDEHWITVTVRPFPILERNYPKRIYQSGCNWTFCSNACGLDLSNFEVVTSLTAESNGQTLLCNHGKAIDYFVPGYVKITSGALNDQYRPVQGNGTGNIVVRIPFDDIIISGTTLLAYRLCPKHWQGCLEADRDNYDHYGGFPFVPREPIL